MRSSKSKIIVGVIAFFLVLSVGYALFSRSLNLSGTAKAEGSFDIIFDRVEKITEEGSKGATATIEETKKHNLEVVVPELQYPGAYASVDTVIKNVGSVDAVLKGIIVKDVNGNEINVDELSSDDIEVTFSGVAKNEVMKPNDEKKITLMFKWKRESVNPSSSVTFEITMQYEQAVGGEDTTTPSSSDFTFPTITGSLGDNVKYTYANGDLSIDGTGDMSGEDNSIAEEIGENSSSTLSNNSESVANVLSLMLPDLINGYSIDDLGGKDEIYNELIKPESEDGYGCSEEEANYVLKVMESTSKIKTVNINEGVTSIRDRLFKGLKVDSITTPNSVSKIGGNAFTSSEIKTVTLGNGMSVISQAIFKDSIIDNIILGNNVTTIETYSFDSVGNLTTITIPALVTTIESNAFVGCNSLTTIVNKTGKAFDWNSILGGTSATSFETGTAEVNGRTVTITK